MTSRVLIVDDESNIRRMLKALLEQESYEVHDIGGGADAPGVVAAFEPDVVLLDLVMPPGPDGIATLEILRARYPDRVVIMMSGKATLTDAVRATKLGAFQFLEKPLTPEGVLVAVKAAIDLSRTRAENRELRAALGTEQTIIGDSPAIEAVRSLIAQVAPTSARVLITGESGTGKELVARAVHDESARASKPLVSLNCAAIPNGLIESEMFGHERGSFTGAVRMRRGKFELADKGTLFLDEVGDLSLQAQAKLLRVLETGVFERVGGEKPIETDVRIVAATNKDLTSAAASGALREDLLYRLNVFPIHVPPLRERREDIAALVAHFSALSAARCGRVAPTFTPEAVQRLAARPWPGNVRELANSVERLTIISPHDEVTPERVETVLGAVPTGTKRDAGPYPAALSAALEQFEADLIREAITKAHGNVAEAARELATDRANLYRRMRRLGINQHDTHVSQ